MTNVTTIFGGGPQASEAEIEKEWNRPHAGVANIDTPEQMRTIAQMAISLTQKDLLFSVGLQSMHLCRDPIEGLWSDPDHKVAAKVKRLKPLDENHAAYLLGRHFRWWKFYKGQDPETGQTRTEVRPVPAWAPKMLCGDWMRTNLIPARGLATAPVMDLDKTLITNRQGFDPVTSLIFALEEDEPEALVDPFKTPQEALVWLVEEWLGDFQIASHRDALLALCIPATMLLARTVLHQDGDKWPAFMVTAPVAATGKTELARCLVAAVLGDQHTVYAQFDEDNQEMAKKLMSIGLMDPPAVIFDNIDNGTAIKSSKFDQWLTQMKFGDRLLGTNRHVEVPSLAVNLLTGNNISVQGDTGTRVLEIRMEPLQEDPHNKQYPRENPLGWTIENRPKILGALAQVLRTPHERQKIGRFNLWFRHVAGPIMEASGDDKLLEQFTNFRAAGPAVSAGLDDLVKAMFGWQTTTGNTDLMGHGVPRTAAAILADHPYEAMTLARASDKQMEALTIADAIAAKDPAKRYERANARKGVTYRLAKALEQTKGVPVMGWAVEVGSTWNSSKGRRETTFRLRKLSGAKGGLGSEPESPATGD